MAKSNKSDSVKIKRGSQEKTISKAQWNAMKKTNAQYGWMLASEVPDDVKTIEQQMELSQVQELQVKLKASEAENAELKQKLAAYEAKTPVDPTTPKDVLEHNLDDLPGELAKIEDVSVLKQLIDDEGKAETPRKGAIKAIDARIAELTKA